MFSYKKYMMYKIMCNTSAQTLRRGFIYKFSDSSGKTTLHNDSPLRVMIPNTNMLLIDMIIIKKKKNEDSLKLAYN